jgi:hypothetical protein
LDRRIGASSRPAAVADSKKKENMKKKKKKKENMKKKKKKKKKRKRKKTNIARLCRNSNPNFPTSVQQPGHYTDCLNRDLHRYCVD